MSKKRAKLPSGLHVFVMAAFFASAGSAAAQQLASLDLSSLSIDELANVEITSVSKRAEPLSQAPASVYVLTRDILHRSGAVNLAEALRLAPNLHVAQVGSSAYGISARGFNHQTATANKLQVLVDGRSVYTPLYSGVFWDSLDVMLEDVDRIEVISGPGGTLWGANAVNGVINVVTRSAGETKGALMSVSLGDGGEKNINARYGAALGENGAFRLYAKGSTYRSSIQPAGIGASDAWDKYQTGFRADWGLDEDSFTIQGDYYDGDSERPPAVLAAPRIHGGNISGSWDRQWNDVALHMQLYYQNETREISSGIVAAVDTYNLDAQAAHVSGRHAFVAGGGYRISRDAFTPGPGTVFLNPATRTLNLGNVFVQDTISLTDTVKATLGLKLEHNSYTGWEFLPNARLAWRLSESSLVWGAVSRAVRTPARFDKELFNTALFAGGPNFDSEELTAYEIGYRGQFAPALSFSASAYYNVYEDLRTVEASTALIFPLVVANGMEGETYGIEIWANYALTDWWQMSAGYNRFEKELRLKPGSRDIFGVIYAGNDPGYQFTLRSAMNPFPRVNFDVMLRAIGALPSPAVPAYVEADARIGWQANDDLELTLAVFNLLHEHHVEFINGSLPRRDVPRSIQAGLRWRF